MKPQLRKFGNCQSPVVIVDDFSASIDRIVDLAAELAPFPIVHDSYYPGVRRLIRTSDAAADRYVEQTCEDAAQFIAGAFEADSFDLVEASFSIVTRAPSQLSAIQRAPHFDSTDPQYLALLHYLRVPDDSGTAFFRQRSTGIEQVTEANRQRFIDAAQEAVAALPPGSGYIRGSNAFYEEIGAIEAVPDRLVIYQGSMLHSGIIPDGMDFSADPREGRLTANLFVRIH